jgi:hypothetical protein
VATLFRFLACVLAAATPILVVGALPGLANWPPLIPPDAPTNLPSGEAGPLLAGLATQLGSLALAVILAVAVLIRDADTRSRSQIVLACLCVVLACASIFAGVQFQLGMAEQLAIWHLDLPRVLPRLNLQAWLLVTAVSCLFVMAVRFVQGRHHAP